MTKNLKTIRDFARYATSRFNEAGLYYGHGTDNAWDEAFALILHTLHLPHDINPLAFEANLTDEECAKIEKLLNLRIEKRIPVPYLTHQAWFLGLPFYVDERVLVPRSPIAELIENHFEPWIQGREITKILDLCTGSGCIAIGCALAFPEARVDASDISADALAVAKMNVLKHHVEEQVTLYQSDLFNSLPAEKYDLIVSNPPYVDKMDMEALPDEYRHEPVLGLASGDDGLNAAIEILKKAAGYLNPEGLLIVEVGNSEVALSERFPEIPFTWIDFERGGGGVFLLSAEQVKACQKLLSDR